MSEIFFHDINFWTGENNLSGKYSVADDKLPGILEERVKKYGILSTTITHFNSFFYSPASGNEMLSDLLIRLDAQKTGEGQKAEHKFYGAMLLEHESVHRSESFKKTLINRYRQGFRLIRLFPKTHKYPYSAGLMKDIYGVLDDLCFPVMINLDEIDITGDKCIEWEKLLEIADKFKNIPLIVDGGDAKELMFNSYFFILLKNSTNIFLSTHNLFGTNQIEDLVSVSGAGRLLFDSYFPFYEPYISAERILVSGLPDESKRMIAFQNIEKIYSGIKIR
jgi:predicted TIM-barrel fold metal-dependent hydrolase